MVRSPRLVFSVLFAGRPATATRPTWVAAAVMALVVAACGEGPPPVPVAPGSDAALRDAGGPSDAGSPADAATPDGGADAGGLTDGGQRGDAAVSSDGGEMDAGSTDAGPTAPDSGGFDAGPTDAGPTDAGPTDAGPTDAGAADPDTGFGGYDAGSVLDAGPDDGVLRVLVIGPGENRPETVASALEEALTGMGAYTDVETEHLVTPTGRLLNFVYGWTGRAERLAPIDAGWDLVVFSDPYWSLPASPSELFEAARVLADLARAASAVPVFLMRAAPEPAPLASGELCADTCASAGDGTCQDDFPPFCAVGTDCTDCGSRTGADLRAESVEALFWRIANGTGSVAVPAAIVFERAAASASEWAAVATASLVTAITGESAAGHLTVAGTAAERTDEIAAAALAQHVADRSTVHYSGPHRGTVRAEPVAIRSPFRFASAGTSSENLWRGAMRALLMREGVSLVEANIGMCSASRRVTADCVAAATAPMLDPFDVLYARGYALDADDIRVAWSTPGLQAQAYDRHFDSASTDGVSSLDDIYDRGFWPSVLARYYGTAWLPQHINFAKLKLAHPTAALLSDGVHATAAVLDGLAAMSWVARTGRSPSVAGLDAESATAVSAGAHTIRTMAAFSRTGTPVADVPSSRVVLAP